MDTNKKVKVRNRSNSIVIYRVPDLGVRREFAPGETKILPAAELVALAQKSGGLSILRDELYIDDPDTVKETTMHVEPEYYLDDNGVIDLLKNGSVDALLDCLDFAPGGVIDLVQKYALSLPVTDTRKIKAIKDKTGFDVALALKHKAELEAEAAAAAEETSSGMKVERASQRRVQPSTAENTESSGGRRETPKYKVVTPKEG